MRLIDLTMTTQPHWRWAVEIEQVQDFDRGDPFRSTVAKIPMHSYTHTDSPLHVAPGRHTIDQVELGELCGPACLADLTPVEANMEIGPELLSQRASHLQEGDVLLLKTRWDEQRSPATPEFWQDAPFVNEAGAVWISQQPIKAVGFDFPQDRAIRDLPGRHPSVDEMPCHKHALAKGIYQIEYLCNLGQVTQPRVTFMAFPLKVKGAEGAPTRAAVML